MSIFPEKMIDEVRRRLDPETVLRRINYRPEMIQDTTTGLKAFCPIHKETIFRTLLIDRDSGRFRCTNYSCLGGRGGDMIDLYAMAMGLGYEQALLELAHLHDLALDLSCLDQYLAHTLEVAHNYYQLGALAEAEENFDRLLRFREDYQPALEGLIELYQTTDRLAKAQSARSRLAHLLADQKAYAQALTLLQDVLDRDGDDEDTHLFYIECLQRSGQGEAAAEASLRLGGVLAARGEIDRALTIYRQAEAMHPVSVDVNEPIIELLVSTGRREEAIAEHLKQADHQSELNNPLGVGRALEAALVLDPSREDLCLRLARVAAEFGIEGELLDSACRHVGRLITLGAHGPARQALETLIEVFRANPQLLATWGDLEEACGHEEAALDFRLHGIDQFQQRGEHEAALKLLGRTMDGREDNVALLSRKANLLRILGRCEEAVRIYLSIVELFRQSDEFENAAGVCQTVIDLEPDVPEHRERQFELYSRQGLEPIIVQKALELVEFYVARGETPRATNLLSLALSRVPESPQLLQRHAEILEECGRRAEAAEQFLAVGRLYQALPDLEQARVALDRVLRCVPEHLEGRLALADVLAAHGDTLQAIGIYNDLAEFYLREKEADIAITVVQKLLTLQPDHAPTMQLLARAYAFARQPARQLTTLMELVDHFINEKSYSRAAELCEEMLSQQDDYVPALKKLAEIAGLSGQGSQSVRHYWSLSQAYARAGQREAEQEALDHILEQEPLHAGACFRYLELHMLWAAPQDLKAAIDRVINAHEAAGQAEAAIKILEDLRLSTNPKAEIYAGLARLYRAKGDIEELRSALRMQAEWLGRLLRDAEALSVWQELNELHTDDMTPMRMRIEIMLRNNMMDEVVEEYRRLGQTLAENRRYEEAQLALLEVLNLNSRDEAARDTLITILIKSRNYAQASEQIQEAAMQWLENNRYEEAICVYKRTFEYDPSNSEIWRRIVAIRHRMDDLPGALDAYVHLLDCLEAKDAAAEFEQVAQEAIGLQPDSWPIRQRLAGFYAFHSRPRDAEGVLLTLAVRQIEGGQIEEAETTLSRILDLNPDSVPARAHRAELLARKGMTEEALQEYVTLTGSLAMATVIGPAQPAATADTTGFRSGNYAGIKLIKDYTFESFIVGTRNNFAHATAMAICRAPGRNYNPLFLYSDVGMGKTHLCHAIAHSIIDRHPEMEVLYTTTEEFVAELIDAIQGNQMTVFRNKHKLKDVLIVDDVQFLSGKERAQEEFFNVFNALFQAGKQVILTSDRPPKDIGHLEKRLRSRFGAGIIVDIQPPDLETRIAILRQEMETRGKKDALNDDVILYVAEHIETNVRDLKGALNQLLARQELSGVEIDVVTTRNLLLQHVTHC